MGKWAAEVALEPIEFDGDTIKFTVGRLLTKDMGKMAAHYNANEGKLQFSSNAEVCALAADLFPTYVRGVTGMVKGDGTPFSREEFLVAANEFYFLPLVGALFVKLMAVSTLQKEEVKNSEPPSVESSGA